MNRREYSLIGKVVSGLRGYVAGTQCPIKELVCESFVSVLEEKYGNFDKEKFRADCDRG